MSSSVPTTDSGVSRLIWCLIGPMMLLVLAIMIAEKKGGWLGGSSLAYLLVLGGTALARWRDYRSGNSLTADGEPTTAAHLRSYFLTIPPLGLAVWLAANWLGTR